ncbi:MAG: hypothetical protein HYZ72_13740 [Deltaproteobacteria bacterium]|nr:hypothetical protein [Deltaproteobacteria bacterium]
MLDAQTEKTLVQFTQEVRQLLADELVAVALYGSGAGANFVPGVSDLNVAIVVKEARFEVLQKLQPRIAAWHKLGFALPLLLDREFLQRGRDVFPMEFHDIKEQHRLLWGEEVFRDLEIDTRHLRFQAEHEARSKLLRLRALYLECAGDQPRLRALMLDSLKTFLILMRNLIRMRGKEGLLTYTEVLDQFEQHFRCSFPRMHQLIAIRAGQQQWPATTAADFFRDYLAEVQQVVSVIDRLLSHASSTHGQPG